MLRGPHSTTQPGVGPVLVLSVRYALKRKEKENIASNCKKNQRGRNRCQERRKKSILLITAKNEEWA